MTKRVVPIRCANADIGDALMSVQIESVVAPSAVVSAVAVGALSRTAHTDSQCFIGKGTNSAVLALRAAGQKSNHARQTLSLRCASFTWENTQSTSRCDQLIIVCGDGNN